jgi:PBP1b-binding outer membrane lipoprotein LpoB
MYITRMRRLLMIVLLTLSLQGCEFSDSDAPETPMDKLVPPIKKVDFNTEIKPILQARCQPCHFQGGKVYDKMPFDKAETITRLGTKLFTRIKDEKERSVIREFLNN